MITAESLITKQNVPLRQNSALFNKWSKAATLFDNSIEAAIVCLPWYHIFFGVVAVACLFVTVEYNNTSFVNQTVTKGLNDFDVGNASELIRQLRKYSNGTKIELEFDNQVASLTFEETKTDIQKKWEMVELFRDMLIWLSIFPASASLLYMLERHVLSHRAFISFGPYSTALSRRFLFAYIAICTVFLLFSKFHPVACVDFILFIAIRLFFGYRYSWSKAAYFDVIWRYSQYEDKALTINASELNKQIFLLNAVRKELIGKTSKLTDVILVKAPVNLKFVVKGLLLEEYEESGQMDSTDAVIELKRYNQYCDLYGSICADKELTIVKDPTIDNNKKPTDPGSSTSDLLSHVL